MNVNSHSWATPVRRSGNYADTGADRNLQYPYLMKPCKTPTLMWLT